MTYEVKGLNDNDALQLLKWKALRKEKAALKRSVNFASRKEKTDPDYELVLNRVVTFASGLPLALEVIGSNLYGKSMKGWETAIEQYERIPESKILNMKVLNILKVSFDGLEEEKKRVFLHIACFLKGYALREVHDILHAYYGRSMKRHIDVLVEKSLLKFHYLEGRLTLHNLIEDMAKRIVRMELREELGKNSRLWLPKDMIHVSEYNTVSETRECLVPYLNCSFFSIYHTLTSFCNILVLWLIRAFCIDREPVKVQLTIMISSYLTKNEKYDGMQTPSGGPIAAKNLLKNFK